MSQAFYRVEDFPGIAQMQRRWRDILSEYHAVCSELTSYVERNLFDQGWEIFGLWNLPHREPIFGGVERCPLTASLTTEHIPGHGAVAFSVLRPGTRIKPHKGRPGPFLRCHIGLEVPPGDCAIRVAGETRRWRAGEALIFDDRLEHEAWNASEGTRAVLLFDFEPGKLAQGSPG